MPGASFMFQLETLEIIQMFAWSVALIEFILGLYIILLNPWANANRRVGILMIIFAINSYAIGAFTIAELFDQARLPSILIAVTTPMAQPGLLIVTIILLKERWLQSRLKYLWWGLYALFFAPLVLTILDLTTATNLWYSGFNPDTYLGGYLPISTYTQGEISAWFRGLMIYGLSIFVIIPQFYFAFFDRTLPSTTRRLAFILLGTQVAAQIVNISLIFTIEVSLALLITSTVFVVGYGYAAFAQMLSERHLQRGNLQPRLTILVLAIALPGPLQRRLPFAVDTCGISLVLQQNSSDLRVPFLCSEMQRCQAGIGHRIDLRAGVNQYFRNFSTSAIRGFVQWTIAVCSLYRVNVGSAFDQQLHDISMSIPTSPVQGRGASGVPRRPFNCVNGGALLDQRGELLLLPGTPLHDRRAGRALRTPGRYGPGLLPAGNARGRLPAAVLGLAGGRDPAHHLHVAAGRRPPEAPPPGAGHGDARRALGHSLPLRQRPQPPAPPGAPLPPARPVLHGGDLLGAAGLAKAAGRGCPAAGRRGNLARLHLLLLAPRL